MKKLLLITTAFIATKMIMAQNFVLLNNLGNANENVQVLYMQNSDNNITPQFQQLVANNIANQMPQAVQVQRKVRNTTPQQSNKEINRGNLVKVNELSSINVSLIQNVSEPELQISQLKLPEQNKSSDKKSISLNIKTPELSFANSTAKSKSSKTQISKKRKKKNGKLSKNRGIMNVKANYELCYKF